MKIENISDGKIIGIGDITVLPGETKEVPADYENNDSLETYVSMGYAKLYKDKKRTKVEAKAEETKVEEKADPEALRLARLESLKGASDEEVAALAKELGINPADCKDQADVLKKVRAALKK